MSNWFTAIREAIDTMGIAFALASLSLFAALAQAASSDRLSLRDFLLGASMSGFVIWMAWLGLSYLNLPESMRVFWSGVASFGAQWILRGANTVLREFAVHPIDTLLKLKALLTGHGKVPAPSSPKGDEHDDVR